MLQEVGELLAVAARGGGALGEDELESCPTLLSMLTSKGMLDVAQGGSRGCPRICTL
jgi:hypothetical protein